MTQVVAVTDWKSRQSLFGAELSSAFAAAGIGLQLRTHRELAAEVSIEQPAGSEPALYPDRPLLWLSPGDSGRPSTMDGRFLASEAYAAARSIALLTRAPVLNRPSAVSACGTLPPGRALAVRRARHHDPDAIVRAERFTRRWLPEDVESGRPEVQDYVTGRSSFGRSPNSSGPFRHRVSVDSADLVKVRVAGDRTITTKHVELTTLQASQRIADRYELNLATLWWLIGKESGTRTLARIDCWMFDAGLGAEMGLVADGVMAWVADRLRLTAGIAR